MKLPLLKRLFPLKKEKKKKSHDFLQTTFLRQLLRTRWFELRVSYDRKERAGLVISTSVLGWPGGGVLSGKSFRTLSVERIHRRASELETSLLRTERLWMQAPLRDYWKLHSWKVRRQQPTWMDPTEVWTRAAGRSLLSPSISSSVSIDHFNRLSERRLQE